MRKIVVIGAACGCGAQNPDTREGPEALRSCDAFHGAPGQAVDWQAILEASCPPGGRPLPVVRTLCASLARRVQQTLEQGHFPLVVGGDHSCAVGTWSGARQALKEYGPLGLIWIDAHMDSHTFLTTPSGALHGMPLACLLGHGVPELTQLAAPETKLRPEHVCLIGVRSYETGEAKLLRELGVRVFAMDEIRQRGLPSVFDEAFSIVERGTAGFGVSLDLDALDPEEESGVGSPAPGGLKRADLAWELSRLRGLPEFRAMEIVEFNPRKDRNGATRRAAAELFEAVTPV